MKEGSKIHSVEVRSFECLDKKIDGVLQEIIKESTDESTVQLVGENDRIGKDERAH